MPKTKRYSECSTPAGVGEVVGAAGGGEDEGRDLGTAEDGELAGLLEEALPALGEGDLADRLVVDPSQHHLSPSPCQMMI